MSDCLGSKRLRDVHTRVSYLLQKYKYNENKQVQIFDLCEFCEMKEDLDVSVPMLSRKQSYLNCSGIDWICQAKSEANKTEMILWNQYTLMSQEHYSEVVEEVLETLEARAAMQSLYLFHKELKTEQPHMTNTTLCSEEMMCKSYIPMKLANDTFPVPALGKEYLKEYVAPLFPDACPLQHPGLQGVLLPEETTQPDECWTPEAVDPDTLVEAESSKLKPVQPCWDNVFQFLEEEKVMLRNHNNHSNFTPVQRELDLSRAMAMVDSRCSEVMTHLNALTDLKDPCEFCKNLKRSAPDRIVECTGLQDVCVFKYEFYREWPVGMFREKSYNDTILNCTTRNKYMKLLNKIFSLKYIERAMRVKEIMDSDLLVISPHLAPVIKQYNALLYRYYWPYPLDQDKIEFPARSVSGSETSSYIDSDTDIEFNKM